MQRTRYVAGLTVIVVGLLVLSVSTVWAQDGTPDSAATDLRWFDHFVVAGGWITWAILLPLSVATVALAVHHAVTIRRATILPAEAEQRLGELLEKREYAEAIQYTSQEPSMLSYTVNTALVEAGRGFAAMERALSESLEDRSARLLRRIEYLNVIGNVSPMVGLFGTVYGMIRLFASIRAAGAIPEPARIADDISIALVTTFWGLAVAIPALSVFALFRNRIDVLTAECALVCEKLLTVFKPGGEGGASRPPASAAASATAS